MKSGIYIYKIGLPPKFTSNIAGFLSCSYVTQVKEEAEYLLFPINYEVLFEYSQEEYDGIGVVETELSQAREVYFRCLKEAAELNVKALIFYYRDPVNHLPVSEENVVVYRTSLLKSKRLKNEFAMPAWVEDVNLHAGKNYFEPLSKTIHPKITFRGQSAPFNLSLSTSCRMMAQKAINLLKIDKKIPLHYNYGYLCRRSAMISCLKNKNIETDFAITDSSKSVPQKDYKQNYFSSIRNSQYNICASGHGNYSYRLYETMAASRIPVFINTDCVLPFEEHIDWKKYVVWIEESDAGRTAEILLDFHYSIHPDDFLKLQKDVRALWEKYLNSEGFFQNFQEFTLTSAM